MTQWGENQIEKTLETGLYTGLQGFNLLGGSRGLRQWVNRRANWGFYAPQSGFSGYKYI